MSRIRYRSEIMTTTQMTQTGQDDMLEYIYQSMIDQEDR